MLLHLGNRQALLRCILKVSSFLLCYILSGSFLIMGRDTDQHPFVALHTVSQIGRSQEL